MTANINQMGQISPAYYASSIGGFLESSLEQIIGSLAEKSGFSIEIEQRNAWLDQIEILKAALVGVEGKIFLEFNVPRIGTRIDAVLISGPAILVIELLIHGANWASVHAEF